MNDLHTAFAEARKVASKAFFNAFAGEGYDPEDLKIAPTDVKARCFRKMELSAEKFLKEKGILTILSATENQ